MKESQAWLAQVDSDWLTAEIIARSRRPEIYCQEIAKYQQVVEKSINVIDSVARERGITVGRARAEHYPIHMIKRLVNLPRKSRPDIVDVIAQQVLPRLWQPAIHDLCRLAPRLPVPGDSYARNTEYPYNLGDEWTAPAVQGSFDVVEADRFKRVAVHLRGWAHRIYSSP